MNEMPKKITMFMLILFLSSFVLIACTAKESTHEEHSISSVIYDFSVNEQGVLVVIDEILWFYDFESGEKTIVCNVPNCPHEPFHHTTNPDPICLAALPEEGSFEAVNLYDNDIYIFANEGINETVVYQIDLEGNSRKKLATFDWNINVINDFETFDGVAYFSVMKTLMGEDPISGVVGSTGYEFAAMSLDLNTGEQALHGEVKDDYLAGIYKFKKVGNKLYYQYHYIDWEGEGEYDFSAEENIADRPISMYLYEFDLETDEERILFDLIELGDTLYDYDKDRLYFLSEDKTEFFATDWDLSKSEVLFTDEDISVDGELGDGFIYSQHNINDGSYYYYDMQSKKMHSFKRPDVEPVLFAHNEWIFFHSNFIDGQVDLIGMKRDDFLSGKENQILLR